MEFDDALSLAIRDLITSYHELNPALIEEYHDEPSPLEFMRHVARNRPFVVRRGAQLWPALSKWDAAYLRDVMEGQSVNVAMTPAGNADSVLSLGGGETMFVKPYEQDVPFVEALERISRQELHAESYAGPVCYAQTQNDNLRNEYEPLFKDVPKSIPFARIALQRDPDAVNFWLGNARSVTALHKDPYENLYVQVLGQKHFVLLPPVEAVCINETMHPAGTYQRVSDLAPETASTALAPPSFDNDETGPQLRAVLDGPAARVPFANWDPDSPDKNATPFSHLSRPLRVTLDPGDMLYLPALWYHKVSQSCSEEGICCAVNYWYDMEYTGSFYALSSFARNVGLVGTKSDAFDARARDAANADVDGDSTQGNG